MNKGKSIFAQLMSLFPEYMFRQCVARYNGDRYMIKFSCRDQFMGMSFAQLTSQQSLRANEAALTAFESKVCPLAGFHHDKGAIKMHTLLNLRGSIPTFVHLTEGRVHDTKAMDELPVEAFAYYLMDKGYVEFKRLYRLFHKQLAFFVTRAKCNMKSEVVEERAVDKAAGLICDQDIILTGSRTSTYYPERIRMVVYEDYATDNVYTFITNNFSIPALTIAELYRERWYVETFFKFIKGHLHIKSFYGISRNAVYTQI